MKNERIKLFIMDVDGTLTDGAINISSKGEIFKSFNVKDGYGIKLLIQNDIIPSIITTRKSKIVSKRAKELGIREVYQGVSDKATIVHLLKEKYNINYFQIAYVGDDLNDLNAIKLAGYKFSIANAAKEIKNIADYVSPLDGGNGAVRDIIDRILFDNFEKGEKV